jgi:outer membrane lipoprotein-sorting protein
MVVCLLCLIIRVEQSQSQTAPLSPKEVLDIVDDLYRGKSSHGKMEMIITTAYWKRTLGLEFWSKGKEKSLIRMLAPKKEKGTTTLRSGNDIWNFLPKVKRVIKLPSSMMSASWMGSHFTNDDLVKESRMADDYTFEISFEGERDGLEIIEISCHPKPDAAVVWGKVMVTVRRDDYTPLDIKYYDEDFKLARTMTFSEVGTVGDRTLPKVLTVLPADKPKERTVIRYSHINFDLELRDDLFSIRTLQR